MSAECVTDAMAKAARLRFEADEADDVVDWYAVVGAALSAADVVRDGSASRAMDAFAVIDETIRFLERLAPTPLGGINEAPEHFFGRLYDLKIAYAAIAALRQPVTLREVTERDAYSMTCALSNVAIIPMLTMLAALRTILPHGVPAIAHQESRNGSEGESA